MENESSIISSIKRKQCVETGILSTLIVLIVQLKTGIHELTMLSLALSLITLVLPWIFFPIAIVWFGFAKILGAIMPRILLTMIFFLVITPVGLIRRMAGKDKLKLRQFKRQRSSALVERNHVFNASDLNDSF
jgi:hypothetical protein